MIKILWLNQLIYNVAKFSLVRLYQIDIFMFPQAQQLRSQMRQFNHTAIFAFNRRFHLLLRQLDVQVICHYSIITKQSAFKNMIITQKYQIIRLSKAPYHRQDLLEYIQMISDEDVLKVYQGIIGLHKFKQVLNDRREVNVLATNLIPKLAALVRKQQHQYLQTHALSLLHFLANSITGNLFPLYFNSTSIHYAIFIDALNLYTVNTLSIQLLKILNGRCSPASFINNSDDNLAFLHSLQTFVGKCSVAQLKMVSSTLRHVNISISPNHQQFANKFFQIKRKVLYAFRKKRLQHEANVQIEQITEIQRQKMEQYFDVNGLDQFVSYIKQILHTIYRLNYYSQNRIFHQFLRKIIKFKHKKSRQVCDVFLKCIKNELINQPVQDPNKNWKFAKNCLNIVQSMLLAGNSYMNERIIEKQDIFARMARLYACKDMKLNSILNQIVINIITLKEKGLKILQQYSLIRLYFSNFNEYCKSASRRGLRLIFWCINDLKKSNHKFYIVMRREIATEFNYVNINKAKSELSRNGMEELFDFYENMWTEEKKCSSEDHAVVTNRPIQKNIQSQNQEEEQLSKNKSNSQHI